MTGVQNIRAPYGIWSGFETAHIFPIGSESLWIEHGHVQQARDVISEVTTLHSLRSGFLLQAHIHIDFNNYPVAVNPDVSVEADFQLVILH
jgi:hypothetical protein